MQKNTAGQKWVVFAFNRTDNTPLTGDAANITANLRIDGASANAVDDTNPTELEDGFYIFDITQTETNGDCILITPASSTADIQVIGVPGVVWTTPANFGALGIESDGDLTKCNLLDGHTAQTGNSYARLGAPVGASLSADLAVMDANVDQIETAVITNATGADIAADIIAMKAETVLIVADTSEIQTDWANGGRLDVILDTAATAAGGDATEAKQDTILANLATVDTVVDSVLVDTGTTIPASIATVDGNVDSILVDTGTTLPASIAVVDANVDSILVDTGTTLPASIATVDTVVDSILVDTAVIGAAGAGLTALSTAANLATAQTDLTQIKADLPSKITKNTALANFMFLMITASDDITPLTGATVTATRSIDGATFGSCANSAAEVSNGWYKISLDAADLNGDTIALRFVATLANDTNISIITQP